MSVPETGYHGLLNIEIPSKLRACLIPSRSVLYVVLREATYERVTETFSLYEPTLPPPSFCKGTFRYGSTNLWPNYYDSRPQAQYF